MKNYVLRFYDLWFPKNNCTIDKTTMDNKDFIEICFYDESNEIKHSFNLDKLTAIKFKKELREEIKKIK